MKITLNTLFAGCFVAATAMPAAADTIVEIAVGDERFSTLVAAVSAAGLVDTLSGPGPFTVFAPVNDAFAALPEGTVETLLMPENAEQLTNVLLYHVTSGAMMAGDIPAGATSVTPALDTDTLCVTADANGVTIADGTGEMANVIIADIQADNGVIHVIDKVLLPGQDVMCN